MEAGQITKKIEKPKERVLDIYYRDEELDLQYRKQYVFIHPKGFSNYNNAIDFKAICTVALQEITHYEGVKIGNKTLLNNKTTE